MTGEYLFISDCHLDSRRPEIGAALIEFLHHRATLASRLYILGDLVVFFVDRRNVLDYGIYFSPV